MDVLVNHEEELKQMDIELCNLYFKAIYNLLDMDDQKNIDGFTRYLELLRTEANANCEFYENSKGHDDSLRNLFFDNLFYRLAYVYRNSTLYSSAVAFQFKNVLHHNPNLLNRLIRKQTINLCSIGCGPASDIVALIKVLESACRRKGVRPDFRVTVVDANLSWKNTFLGILRCFPMFERDIWKVKFIHADVSQFFSVETVEAIQKADVVSLMKFSSEFVSGYMSCKETITEISEFMAARSLLFFLDRSQYDVIKSCGGVHGYLPNFCLIYEEAYDFFNLHLSAVETNYHLYEKHFGANVCNTCFKVFCRAFIKSGCTCNNLACSPDWLRRESTSSLDSQIRTSERGDSFECLPLKGFRITSFEEEIDIGACLEPSWIKQQAEKCLQVSKIENRQVFSNLASGNIFPDSIAEECGKSKEAVKLGTQNLAPPHRGNTEVRQVTSEFALFPTSQDTGKCVPCQQNKNCLLYSPRKRFENTREKFDALEFFRERPFIYWQYFFGRRMAMVGWNENGFQTYNRSYNEMWGKLSLDLEKRMKRVEEAKAMLISHLNEQSGRNIDHSIWKEFIAAKRQLATSKRTIYCEIVISLRGYLKSKFPISNY